MSNQSLQLLGCKIDLKQGTVVGTAEGLSLTSRELSLLTYLIARPGEVVSREELLLVVWGYSPEVISRAVDKTMARLRKKIERDPLNPDHLVTEYGVGFRFLPAPPTEDALPTNPTRFFGRVEEQNQLRQQIAEGCRLLTILGMGGLGKTRLAVEVASSLGKRVWFCDLSAVRTRADCCIAAGRAMEIQLVHGDPETQLRAALMDRSGVLILDNFEQLVDVAADLVGTWVQGSPGMVFLVTSRRRLELTVERLLPLEPLPLEDVMELFLDRARAVCPDLEVTRPQLEAVAERLEGLALAVELAAARTRLLSLEQLEAQLQGDLHRVLRDRSRDRAARHSTLSALLDGSWEWLDDNCRKAISDCGLFRSPFTLEAAQAVLETASDPVDEVLEQLLDHSLLTRIRSPTGPRFRMLQIVLQFVREQNGHSEGAHERHAAYFTRRAAQTQSANRRLLAAEIDDVTAACHWAIAQQDGARAVAAFEKGWHHWYAAGPFSSARALAEAVLSLSSLTPHQQARMEILVGRLLQIMSLPGVDTHFQRALSLSEDEPAIQCRVYTAMGQYARSSGRLEEARTLHTRAVECARESGDTSLEIRSLAMFAPLLEYLENLALARQYHEKALSYYKSTGQDEDEAIVSGNLGRLCYREGRFDEALAHHKRALAHHRADGDCRLIAEIQCGIANVLYRKGLFDEASERMRDALTSLRRVGSLQWEADLLIDLSNVYQASGRLEEAERCSMEALELSRVRNEVPKERGVLGNLGNIYRELGQPKKALSYQDAALTLHRQANDRRSVGRTLGNSAIVWMGEGGDEQARTLLDEAIALTKEVGDHIAEGAFRGCLGLVLTRQGEPDASRQQFKQALALLEQCGDLVEVGLLHTRIAESALWSDEVVRARRALVQAEATHSQLHPAPQSELSLAIASLKSRLT